MLDSERLYTSISERIRRVRETQAPRMSQGDLAAILGLKRTSVTNIECGNQKPSLETLYRLCEYFGLEIAEVLPKVTEVSEGKARSIYFGGRSQEVGVKTANALDRLRRATKGRR
jgi:DNA-binding XRE family transcriptional regulator